MRYVEAIVWTGYGRFVVRITVASTLTVRRAQSMSMSMRVSVSQQQQRRQQLKQLKQQSRFLCSFVRISLIRRVGLARQIARIRRLVNCVYITHTALGFAIRNWEKNSRVLQENKGKQAK